MLETIKQLPIFPYLDRLITAFSNNGLLLLSAAPGAGKTTLLPWQLLAHQAFNHQKLLLLEPRRLAARAAAQRISAMLGEAIGQRVGLRTRLETLVGPKTQLEVVTEGVLIRLIQQQKNLADYGTILFDEFHTRSLAGDLGLALVWAARQQTRPDLKIGILSATLPAEDILSKFPDFPYIEVPGHVFPVEVLNRPPLSAREKPWEGACRLCLDATSLLAASAPATILCFLPGYYEMNQAKSLLSEPARRLNYTVSLLHGQMPPQQQRLILDPLAADSNRIILATNVAETSLTIAGVKAVVDLGLERRVRFSPRTGMDHWQTRPISQASANQRQGRAGRLGPGYCLQWWQPNASKEPFTLPEIMETDLAPLILETADWGVSSPDQLTWLTQPPTASVVQGTTVLQNLDLLDERGHITEHGRATNQFAMHPRLARMVLMFKDSNFCDTAALIAALLEHDDLLSRQEADFSERVQLFKDWTRNHASPGNHGLIKRIFDDCRRILRTLDKEISAPHELHINVHVVGRLLLAAYPDRLAKRTRLEDPITSRWLLASGRGALLKAHLSQEAYLVVTDIDGGEQNAKIFSAAPVSLKEIMSSPAVTPKPNWQIEWRGWQPRTKSTLKLGAIVLKEQPGGQPEQAILKQAALKRIYTKGLSQLPWNQAAHIFLARCRFIAQWGNRPDWPAFSEQALLAQLETWLLPVGNWQGGELWTESTLLRGLKRLLSPQQQVFLDEQAPEVIRLAAGFKKKIDYTAQEFPKLAARLQEFFGTQSTPQLCHQPLVLDILSPANRTIQLTRDIETFWEHTYATVKKEFEGKYPKHHWPDDPKNKKYIKSSK